MTLLKSRHLNNFMIWNISERQYDYEKFDQQVLEFPFGDHHPCPLNMLCDIVNSIHQWLIAAPENVAVVHCKGKDSKKKNLQNYKFH